MFAILGPSTKPREPLDYLPVPDFDADERRLVAQPLLERCGHAVPTDGTDAELAQGPSLHLRTLLQMQSDHEHNRAGMAQ